MRNLTAQTDYEISAWAKSDFGESSAAFEHFNTTGTRPAVPSLKAKATSQTTVECGWVGVKNVVRVIFVVHFFSFIKVEVQPTYGPTSL